MESSVEASQSSPSPNPKPTLGPKPRLTPRPFSVHKNATFRSIIAPKTAEDTSKSKTEPTDPLNATGGGRSALTTPVQPTFISAPKPRPVSLPSENSLELTKASEAVPPTEDSPDSGVSDPAPKTPPPKETPSSEPVQKDNVIQTNHKTSAITLPSLEQKNEIKTEDETPISVPQKPEEPISDSSSTSDSPFRWGGTRKRLSMELTSMFESGGVPLPPQPVKTTTKPDTKCVTVIEEPSEPQQNQAAPKPLTPESDAGEQEDNNKVKSIKDRISCLFDSVGKQEFTGMRDEPESIDCGVPPSPQPVKTSTKPDTKRVSVTEEPSEPEQNQVAPKPVTTESSTGEQEEGYNRRKSIKDRISCLFDSVGRQEVTCLREVPTTIDGIGDVNTQIKNWAAETGSESPDTERKPQLTPRVRSKRLEPATVSPSEETPETLTVEVPAADESQKEPPKQAPAEDKSLEISTETSGENNKTTEGVKLRRPPTPDTTANNVLRRSVKRRSVRFGIVETDDGSPPVVLGSDPESSSEEEEEEEADDEKIKGVHDSVSELGLKTGKNVKQKNQEIEQKEKDDKEARLWFEELRNSMESMNREEVKPREEEEESEGKLLEEKKREKERLREEAVLQQKEIEKERKKEKEKEEKLKQEEEDREREMLKEEEMKRMKERERQRQKEEQERLNKELELRRQKLEEEKRLKQEEQEKERLREEAKEKKRLEEEERMREKLRQEEEMRLREKLRQEEEERLREKQRQEEEKKLKERQRQEEEERLREKQRQEEEKRLKERQRQEEERLREKWRQEEEERLREKQRQEEEKRLKERQRQEEERLREKWRQEEEEERLREKQRQEEEERLREKQRQEEEVRLREKQRQEEEVRLREKQRQEEEVRLKERQRLEEEERLREKKRQEEEARLREEQRQEEEKLREKQRQEESLREKQLQEEEERLREKQRQEEESLREKQRQEEVRLKEKQRQEEERLREKQRQEEARLREKQRQEEEERKKRELERKMQLEKAEELERKIEEERQRGNNLMEKKRAEGLEVKKQEDLEKLHADKHSKTDIEEKNKESNLMMNFDSGHWFQKKESDDSPSLKINKHTETLIDVVFDDFSIKKPSVDVEYDDFSVKPRKWASQTKAEPVSSGWAVDRGYKKDLLMSFDDQPQENQTKEKQVKQKSVLSSVQENPSEKETELLVNLAMKEKQNIEWREDDVEVEEEEEEEAEEEENGEEEEMKEDEVDNSEARINSYFTNDEDKEADVLSDDELHQQYEISKTSSDTPDSPKSISEQLHDADCTDSNKETDFAPFPEMSTPLLDTSTQRSKAHLSRKRNRSRPSRSFRIDSEKMGRLDWRVHDTTDKKETSLAEKELDSEEEEKEEEEEEELSKPKAVTSPPSIIQKVPMFPGLSPAALLAGIKKRTVGEASAAEEKTEKNKETEEKESQNEEVKPSPSQLSQSPRLPSHLAGAARVLPPMVSNDGGAVSSPAWLKELKSKKRMNQHDGKT